MKTKIVYCLVSDTEDHYYEQLLISLCSLRKHNLDAVVEVVCDNDTFATLGGVRRYIYDYDVRAIPIDTPRGWKNWEKSRFLKTNLRKLIKGDYLYLDVDTVVCASLDCVDELTCEVAAVKDGHFEAPIPSYSKRSNGSDVWIWNNAKKANVDVEGYWHFNSGVMYVKDSEKAHELYSIWYEKYSAQLKYGVKVDQLPLLLANAEMNNVISVLDAGLNCQVFYEAGKNILPLAKIVHYFSIQLNTILSHPWIIDPIKETGKINSFIQHVIDNPCDFFSKDSKIITGSDVAFYKTPFLRDSYYGCPKVFRLCLFLIKTCYKVKRKLCKVLK